VRALFTVPNAITAFRLALIPSMLAMTSSDHTSGVVIAAALFGLGAATDWLDGFVARRFHARSRLGAMLDPVADKAMVLGALFIFSDLGLIPLWLVLLNMFRELFMSGLRDILTTPTRIIGANWMGKVKFCIQVGLVELIYIHRILATRGSGLPGGQTTLFFALLAVTIVSFAFLFNFARWEREALTSDVEHA